MESVAKKIIVDPLGNILYKSFYIFALYELLGKKNVVFSSSPFKNLSYDARKSLSVNFILISDDKVSKRFTIDCKDAYYINEELYAWCDVYASVNANYNKTEKRFYSKLISLCPSFAIRCWSSWQIPIYALINLIKAKPINVRNFLGRHYALMKKKEYSSYYNNKQVDNRYIFFVSTLWYNDEWNKNDEGVNKRRANFIRACKEINDLNFEGGLVSQGSERSSESLFDDCLSKAYAFDEWMEKTKRSLCVFNTPAFWDCHGWKLGEFLAMGKAIISTELSNDLPAPLEHGKNIHFVENTVEAMKEAVEYLLDTPDYRKKLENGAREYWEKYGSPTAVMRLLGL